MKTGPLDSLYELPLPELRTHADRAVRALRIVRAHGVELPSATREASSPVPDAISTVERVLAAFLAPPPTVLARTLANLTPRERRALRRAIDEERAARERLLLLLGDVPVSMVEDTLVRIEVRECVLAELVAPWRGAKRDWPSPEC